MTLNMQGKIINNKVVGGIEWTKTILPDGTQIRGATWNPIAGCKHACRWTMPDGTVAICYAESIAEGIASSVYTEGFDNHYWKPHMLDDPLKKKQGIRIFTGSMADIFGHWVPDEQIEAILDVARQTPRHTYQLLTKNPVRTKQFDMPDNVWVGASMPPDHMWGRALTRKQQIKMFHRTMQSLAEANATIKWLSFEPLSWDVTPVVKNYPGVLDWAVIGAASRGSTYYAPDTMHFLNLQTQLDDYNVPVFYKGNLAIMGDITQPWREEFPEAHHASI